MVLTGFPGDPPLKTTVTYIDVSTGLMAAIGVLLALRHRDKTGEGQAIDVSLFDTASFATQALGTLLLYSFTGEIRKQVGNRGFHSFAGCFKSKDKWITVNPATNTIWKRFTKVIGHPEMEKDASFKSDMDRFHNTPFIDPVVAEWVGHRTSQECIKELGDARIPCSAVNTVSDALSDAQVAARNMIEYLYYPGLGKLPVPGSPIKLSKTPAEISTPSPGLGEHNNEIYCGLLGMSNEEVSRLKAENII
jgi:CoA:oxalate CoA-transferase